MEVPIQIPPVPTEPCLIAPPPVNPGDLIGKCVGQIDVWTYKACLSAEQLQRLAAYHLAIAEWQEQAVALCGAPP